MGLADILEEARGVADEAVELRRRIHRQPELGLQLPKTQAAVLEGIAGLPLEVKTGKSTTSAPVSVTSSAQVRASS